MEAQLDAFANTQLITYSVVGVVAVVLAIIASWKIFTKAGVPGWMALIPILREYKFVEIADGKGIKFLLFLIPIVGVVYEIMVMVRLAKAFGKGTGFALGLIFLPIIFWLILGFGSAEYIGPKGESQA